MNPFFDPEDPEKTATGSSFMDENGEWTITECPWEQGSPKILLKFLKASFIVLLVTSFLSLIIYVCLEKPGIDAKRVYRNKHASKTIEK